MLATFFCLKQIVTPSFRRPKNSLILIMQYYHNLNSRVTLASRLPLLFVTSTVHALHKKKHPIIQHWQPHTLVSAQNEIPCVILIFLVFESYAPALRKHFGFPGYRLLYYIFMTFTYCSLRQDGYFPSPSTLHNSLSFKIQLRYYILWEDVFNFALSFKSRLTVHRTLILTHNCCLCKYTVS